MILQVITPDKETFDLSVSLPPDYMGKKVHCLFYVEEEARNMTIPISSNKKPSVFFGNTNYEDSDQFEKHIKQIRNEWGETLSEI